MKLSFIKNNDDSYLLVAYWISIDDFVDMILWLIWLRLCRAGLYRRLPAPKAFGASRQGGRGLLGLADWLDDQAFPKLSRGCGRKIFVRKRRAMSPDVPQCRSNSRPTKVRGSAPKTRCIIMAPARQMPGRVMLEKVKIMNTDTTEQARPAAGPLIQGTNRDANGSAQCRYPRTAGRDDPQVGGHK